MNDHQAVVEGDLWATLQAGGFTMALLILGSLIVWMVLLERVLFFRKLKKDLEKHQIQISAYLLKKDRNSLREYFKSQSFHPLLVLMSFKLDKKGDEFLSRKKQELALGLKERVWLLGTIGSAAPFVGLFGTVVGILRSFREMARTGTGGFTVVAAGISEALVATAAGILVGVIAVFAYNSLNQIAQKLWIEIRSKTEDLMENVESWDLES